MTIIPLPTLGAADAAALRPQRVRLAVAPKSVARVRWAAEARPRPALSPATALDWLTKKVAAGGAVTGIEISGPGDPLATATILFEALEVIRRTFPDMPLEITTLGLGGEAHVRQLADLGVARVNLLVDAVTPETAAKVYAWVRPGTKTVPLPEAVALLIEEQARTATALHRAGIAVRICTTLCPGVNDAEVEEIARKMADLGADSLTLLPAHPENDEDTALVAQLATLVQRHLPLAPAQPAVEPEGEEGASAGNMTGLPKPTATKPNVAVVSIGGMEVDLHLGHAIKALIYGPREDGLIALLAARELPEPGSGQARWEEAAQILHDCFALLTASAGESPKRILGSHDISVVITEGEIDPSVDLLYGGGKKKRSTGSGQQKGPR